MNFTLERKTNFNAWLWSELKSGSEFSCDTLEMGEFFQLQKGIYFLKTAWTQDKQHRFVGIFDGSGRFESIFLINNNYLYKEIVFRKNNNFITVGKKDTEYYLKYQEMNSYNLVKLVSDCEDRNEKVTLEVLNNLDIVKMD